MQTPLPGFMKSWFCVAEAADFETAISATGYGKYNLLLLAAILPSALSQVFEVEGVGYVIPVAQCDLGLTLEMKGILNSVCQSGKYLRFFTQLSE